MNPKYRKTIIAGNWKMNLLPSRLKDYADTLKELLGKEHPCEVVLCVPALMAVPMLRSLRGSRVALGAQDVSAEESGAFTGEISALQLKDAGVKYVIVGHSERRAYHGETDELIGRKLRRVLEAGMTPILCVGETLLQRDAGAEAEVVRAQLKLALAGLDAAAVRKTVIAYEPVWAIGTGRTASPAQAQDMCREIRAAIRESYDARTARAVTIQYGGSMNPANASELLAQPDVDGGLIGGASLDPNKFYQIVEAAKI
ncbi:MAG: triose-phosphate isomerase [Oscillospiraceae bacterium]|nr:triose-phosphate isomerase [Oscillospiraceae bacterium]